MQNSEFRIQKSKAPRAGRLALFAFCILNVALLATATGCASKAKAATTVPDGPPLAMPEPPPRVILVVEDIPAPPPPAPAAARPLIQTKAAISNNVGPKLTSSFNHDEAFSSMAVIATPWSASRRSRSWSAKIGRCVLNSVDVRASG